MIYTTTHLLHRSSAQSILRFLLMTVIPLLLMACSAPPAEQVNAGIEVDKLKISPSLGVPARLALGTIDLNTPVVELGWNTAKGKAGQVFSEWDVANFAAGWHKNSAKPGQGGNIVLSGHNNIRGAVFRELDQLQRGDRAQLYVDDIVYEYAVDEVVIVPEKYASPEQRAQNAQWIRPTNDERLTLVSCWPRDDNTHRIIVVAYPVDGKAATAGK